MDETPKKKPLSEIGHLFLSSVRERQMGGMPYTSGMVTSFESFSQQFGWFEIRARFPRGQGLWPAFWLLPITKAWPPEIDVLEILGHQTNVVYFTTHWSNETTASSHQFKTGSFVGPDFAEDFHTFALEWNADEMIWLVVGDAKTQLPRLKELGFGDPVLLNR